MLRLNGREHPLAENLRKGPHIGMDPAIAV